MHEVFYGGVQFLPSVLPACAERAVLGAVVITYITPSFLISGPYSTLFVICWLGGGLNWGALVLTALSSESDL